MATQVIRHTCDFAEGVTKCLEPTQRRLRLMHRQMNEPAEVSVKSRVETTTQARLKVPLTFRSDPFRSVPGRSDPFQIAAGPLLRWYAVAPVFISEEFGKFHSGDVLQNSVGLERCSSHWQHGAVARTRVRALTSACSVASR